jgi:hypothetical protein
MRPSQHRVEVVALTRTRQSTSTSRSTMPDSDLRPSFKVSEIPFELPVVDGPRKPILGFSRWSQHSRP